MERLTHKARYEAGYKLNKGVHARQATDALGAYENTGLTPAEIMDGKLLTGWIPVEERLPEEGVEVLVTRLGTRGPYVTTDEYQDEFGWESDGYVIAWMPLPEPYRSDALLEAGAEAGQYADAPTLRSAT